MRRSFAIFQGISWAVGGLNDNVFTALVNDDNTAEQLKGEYKATRRK